MIEIAKWRIRQYDEDGTLTAAGFIWFQPRYGLLKFKALVKVLLLIFGWVPVAGLMLRASDPYGPLASAGDLLMTLALAAGGGLIFLIVTRNNIDFFNGKKSVVFYVDGRTEVSDGLAAMDGKLIYRPARNFDQTQIVSVEGRPTPSRSGGQAREGFGELPLYQVDLYLVDGSSVQIAPDVPNEASMRIIQTQIFQALNEVREAQAERPRAARRRG